MNPLPTRYVLLRDRKAWDVPLPAGLAIAPDGSVLLAAIPRPDRPTTLAGPFEVLPSGLCCAPCASRFVSDTAASQVAYADGLCATEVLLPAVAVPGAAPGEFDRPRGLAYLPGRGVFVADSGNARIVVLDDPSLQPVALLAGGFTDPTCLALDSVGRLVVVDGVTGRLSRFLPGGSADVTFNTAVAASGTVSRFIACGPGDVLHAATSSGVLMRFAADGSLLPPLPALDPDVHAGAMAFDGNRLYIADTASGHIVIVDASDGASVALLPDFIGPVTALAVCVTGELWIKTGDDRTIVHCSAGTAFATRGSLTAGPLDAGLRDAWFMVGIDVATPVGTLATVALFVADVPAPGPGPTDWIDVPAAAGLVRNLFGHSARYLWVRVTLQSPDGRASPRLQQVRAETPGEDYLDELPAMYGRDDAPDGTLARMLALLRAQFDRSERILDSLPQRLAIDFARDADLAWIAGWLGFVLPAGMSTAEQRALLQRVIALYDRRATRFGLAEFVHVFTGVRPRIVEAFEERRLWQLGVSSTLGFDTALAPANPLGMVVPDALTLCKTDPPYGCGEPERLTIGSVVVGDGGPLAMAQIGTPLFDGTAHRFRVLVPAWQVPAPALRDTVRGVLEAEKPAHTTYELCFIESAMRVGMQSCIGVDTIVAGEPRAGSLAGMTLGTDSQLTAIDSRGRIGSQSRLGVTTLLV